MIVTERERESKGRTGELNSNLLGMMFVMKFQAAAMSRANIPEDDRVDFCLYVDEFQNFATDSFATIMSEARKFHLNMIVANQFTTQLTEEVRDAVFGNVGTIVSFRIGQNDQEALTRYFQPMFDGDDLLRVPNYNTIVRTLIKGVPTQPFSMATIPSLGTPNKELGEALRQLSSAKHGRPRQIVEKEIFDRLKTQEPAKTQRLPGQPNQPISSHSGVAPAAASPSQAQNASFLDQWLAKRQKGASGPSKQTMRQNSQVGSTAPSSTSPGASISPQQAHTQTVGANTPQIAKPIATTNQNKSPDIASDKVPTPPTQKLTPRSYGDLKHDDTIFIDRDGNLKQT